MTLREEHQISRERLDELVATMLRPRADSIAFFLL